jgi:hypothetical protein
MFDMVLTKHGQRWEWQVCDNAGRAIMRGCEESRPAAKYQGERALFLLLSTPPPGPKRVPPHRRERRGRD